MENSAIFKPLFATNHGSIDVHFSKNSSDFVVREIPLYEFSGQGEHLILQIQKKDLTTNEALSILSGFSGASLRDFGYAGLKDKEGMTTQFISLPAKFESKFAKFSHEKLKILSTNKHNNKIRIGHLKGNSFFIRLKKVLEFDALKITQALKNIDKNGYPNYFGYQRFGKFGDNAEAGLEILKGKRYKNPKLENFLISSYQSELFNRWLSKRVEISKFASDFSRAELREIYKFDEKTIDEFRSQEQFFKLISGEVLGHYPFGKLFLCVDLKSEVEKFVARDRTSCGLIVGNRAFQSSGFARELEDEIYKQSYPYLSKMTGSRRFAWSYLENLDYHYTPEKAHFQMSFTLQKGSYATNILREVLHKEIFD